MDTNVILLLLLVPLIGSLVNVFFGKKLGNGSGIIATVAVLISFIISLLAFIQVNSTKQPIEIELFEWMALANFNVTFGFLLDQLSLLWLLFVTGIGTLIHWYSTNYMKNDENYAKFFAYLNLFIFFMIVLVTGSNLLITFIGWEGVGLCSYLLIGFWHKNQSYNDAAKKAFIMNRIGDLGFLVGVFILAFLFQSLDYMTIKEALMHGTNHQINTWIGWAALALFIGAVGKSAQIPLYTWLPDAMAGPTPVSALIHAATMVTAGIFLITRLNFVFDLAPHIQNIIAIVGAVTSLFAATIGLVQTDIKKVLAYSTVSQLGLMFMAVGFGAYEIAVFHVVTHAFFKACLFLGSGSVIHAMGGEQDMRNMGGLKKFMPATYATFLLATIAISGFPPFSGFFSKDEILLTAFSHNPVLYVIGSIASIMTAFYMFRLLYLTFFKNFRGTQEQKNHLHESPAAITVPLWILGILSVVGGAISLPGNSWLNSYLEPIIVNSANAHPHVLGTTEYILMAIAVIGACIGLFIAYSKYIKKGELPPADEQMTGFHKVLYNKYYIDEIYMKVIVKPIYALAVFFRDVVEVVLSEAIYGLGKIADGLSLQGKKAQNGNIGLYLFAFVFGICLMLYYLFIAR
ncbi:NADH-quinone oxidoreductase subunit L [Myroides odoratus]|jgi:NADH-quinone oxidoreductase subunit L|uniref:NADH-quinone oxidoreductase subunit L n=1 Tax=Myroides odoratus TaxID=256 RepID=A0A9Q7E814_MYROD|nr:NADH-quinone oxidoreductase subunit L [Myroides odoratus]EHQ42734.1 NADH dehydrogenase subunit L [Myroides odoratus DSM 2801]EKB07549.1 proton-translocating NADH-quinone oxidoreductase, chain L [Myroides odoratus CIP 103059]MDR0223668.1 NADH-quinone oxidoreductase subunit L [Myroides odoratus]QQU00091.1 NADH-quinone oxidoreductase subunit L [Myroides odoratus]WQD57688.1 NADH-quinone oxidoreductase subunit L [Myroides odoratus]